MYYTSHLKLYEAKEFSMVFLMETPPLVE